MSRVLLVGRNESLLVQCAAKLRWLGHKVTIHKEIMDGLRELQLFGVSCIMWHVDPLEANRTRKLEAIKRYHRHTPLIIIDTNKDVYGEAHLDTKTTILSNNPGAQEIVHEIIDTIPAPPSLPDNERLEKLEHEYGFVD